MSEALEVTAQDIRKVSEKAVTETGLQPHLNCGAISDAIEQALADELGLQSARVQRGYVIDGGANDEHAYVVIPSRFVSDRRGDVIVDGSVQQFDREHYDAGKVWVCLEDKIKGKLPRVAIQCRDDPLYKYYYEQSPF